MVVTGILGGGGSFFRFSGVFGGDFQDFTARLFVVKDRLIFCSTDLSEAGAIYSSYLAGVEANPGGFEMLIDKEKMSI